MAATATNSFSIQASSCADAPVASRARSRRISPQAGRALRILSHAIEYVANEFLNDVVPPSNHNDRLQAVQLLMALNREVYSECPEAEEVPTFRERCRQFLGYQSA